MATNKIKLIFIISASVIMIGIIFLTGIVKFGSDRANSSDEIISNVPKTIKGDTPDNTSPSYTITQIPISEQTLPKIPNFDQQIIFPENMSPDVRAIIAGNIAQNIDNLKKNPKDVDEWLSLGINRKIVEDFEGAKEAWEYAAYLSPKTAVIFSNLGDLYGYYLKDFSKAEMNFKKAISNDLTFPNYYIKTADFYREVEKDLSKAKAILIEGLSVIKDDMNLKNALDNVNSLISKQSNSFN